MYNQNYIRDDKHRARGKDSKTMAKYECNCMGERESCIRGHQNYFMLLKSGLNIG